MELSHIRNFCIVAHIDHGKSTLADRLLEVTGTVAAREMRDQMLDRMDLERERGITIKAKAVRMAARGPDGEEFELNLIDTPGHVDFGYEVSRALTACEGALLVVDAVQGVEAQTVANAHLASNASLVLVPVINKIDLPAADPDRVRKQIEEIIGIDASDALLVSAKSGLGIEQAVPAILERIPAPKGEPIASLRALIFDSFYDRHRGVLVTIRVFDGSVRVGQSVALMSTGYAFKVEEVGVFSPEMRPVEELRAGEVGYLAGNVRQVSLTRVGDTVTDAARPTAAAMPGFREAKAMVFCGLYPVSPEGYVTLRDAIEKLRLSDASIHIEPETSAALGFGFRCGFLGLLHLEIVQERLEREYGVSLVATAPSVVYEVKKTDGEVLWIDNPVKMPPPGEIESVAEPMLRLTMMTPTEYVGAVMQLCQERRGAQKNVEYLTGGTVVLTYEIPLSEIVLDFYDRLKSATRGYASMDYEQVGYQVDDLVKVDLLLNHEPVDALSFMVHRDKAYARSRVLCEKLKEIIPRQLFEVPIQAAIGGHVLARETIPAQRKNVLAKCYGGDVSRKRKLLEKQKEGKKRLKSVGRVELPQEAFLAVLRTES